MKRHFGIAGYIFVTREEGGDDYFALVSLHFNICHGLHFCNP